MLTQELTHKLLISILHFDEMTGVFIWKKPKSLSGKIAGCVNSAGYHHIMIWGVSYPAHRLAWLYMNREWPENQIDHINGNRSDNRIENLRDVSCSGNAQNQRKASSNNKLGVLGVSINCGRYIAQITVNNKNIVIGRYKTLAGARNAYLKMKRKIHKTCTI